MASSLEYNSGALTLNNICYKQIKGNWVDIYEIRESNNDPVNKQITCQYVPECLQINILNPTKGYKIIF